MKQDLSPLYIEDTSPGHLWYCRNCRVKQFTNFIALFLASTVRMRVNTSVKLPMLNWAPVAVVNEKSIFKVCIPFETPLAF